MGFPLAPRTARSDMPGWTSGHSHRSSGQFGVGFAHISAHHESSAIGDTLVQPIRAPPTSWSVTVLPRLCKVFGVCTGWVGTSELKSSMFTTLEDSSWLLRPSQAVTDTKIGRNGFGG
jgi:hypothetical protein